MNADAMTTRLSVLTQALPSRILLVDDDELEVELLSERLAGGGFEVTCAANGQEALALIERQWYPVVITDWQMPVMTGLEFTEALRGRGVTDTYVIMLTIRESSADYERGYVCGVDDYLSKKVPDAELFARISGAFNTLVLRRSLHEAQAALEQSVTIDAQSGAFAPSELQAKLHGEIRRAQRYGRQLAVIDVGVRTLEGGRTPNAEQLRGVVQVLSASVRAHIDWIGRLHTADGAAFAVVLPEAGISEAPLIKDRLQAALQRYGESVRGSDLTFCFGIAAVERGGHGVPLEAKEMLDVAEHCRRCAGCAGPEQLGAVQRSVACHVSIVCRRGYVVDNECSLKRRGWPADAQDVAQPLAD